MDDYASFLKYVNIRNSKILFDRCELIVKGLNLKNKWELQGDNDDYLMYYINDKLRIYILPDYNSVYLRNTDYSNLPRKQCQMNMDTFDPIKFKEEILSLHPELKIFSI